MPADSMTPEQRSYCMSRVKSKDTTMELVVRSELHRVGLRFRKNYAKLPGKPDVAFPRAKLAVFLDGDFWHGRDFSSWKGRLSEYWLKKITRNRERDQANFSEIRRMGWSVMRLWERDVKEDLAESIAKIVDSLDAAAAAAGAPAPGATVEALKSSPSACWKDRAKALAKAPGKGAANGAKGKPKGAKGKPKDGAEDGRESARKGARKL
ncbi:MAG: very short patch repair endonuclease [Deltaproteobacteria bacterium]|jgi:DNA mismatch endonuclease (patch repair protein)|nr:very short patch repair endonuclease [Deltaproteobacteria bacterium]